MPVSQIPRRRSRVSVGHGFRRDVWHKVGAKRIPLRGFSRSKLALRVRLPRLQVLRAAALAPLGGRTFRSDNQQPSLARFVDHGFSRDLCSRRLAPSDALILSQQVFESSANAVHSDSAAPQPW